jgi:hypothetical protein
MDIGAVDRSTVCVVQLNSLNGQAKKKMFSQWTFPPVAMPDVLPIFLSKGRSELASWSNVDLVELECRPCRQNKKPMAAWSLVLVIDSRGQDTVPRDLLFRKPTRRRSDVPGDLSGFPLLARMRPALFKNKIKTMHSLASLFFAYDCLFHSCVQIVLKQVYGWPIMSLLVRFSSQLHLARCRLLVSNQQLNRRRMPF